MNPLNFVISSLATYRLVKLVKDDKITENFREATFRRFGEPQDSKVSYLVTCPWCLGIYAGAAVAFVDTMFSDSRTASVARSALAFSAIAGIMAEREDHDDF